MPSRHYYCFMYMKIMGKHELLTIKLSSHLPKNTWKTPGSAQVQLWWSLGCAAHKAVASECSAGLCSSLRVVSSFFFYSYSGMSSG